MNRLENHPITKTEHSFLCIGNADTLNRDHDLEDKMPDEDEWIVELDVPICAPTNSSLLWI